MTPRRRIRLIPPLAALGAALLVLACEDPFKLTASRSNDSLNFVVWAITGTPDEYPTALRIPQSTLVLPLPDGNFDIAFDLNPNDSLVILPVQSVVTPLLGAHSVTFFRTAAVFDQIVEAPINGWTADSAFVVGVGETFLVKVSGSFCQFELRQEIYAKFEVESIIPSERRARLRGKVDPNCGFRSLQDGIPEY